MKIMIEPCLRKKNKKVRPITFGLTRILDKFRVSETLALRLKVRFSENLLSAITGERGGVRFSN